MSSPYKIKGQFLNEREKKVLLLFVFVCPVEGYRQLYSTWVFYDNIKPLHIANREQGVCVAIAIHNVSVQNVHIKKITRVFASRSPNLVSLNFCSILGNSRSWHYILLRKELFL